MKEQSQLASFVARCDPAAPPPENSYVPRIKPFFHHVVAALMPAQQRRVLVIGQTGVGKTTELTAAQQALQEDYLAVRPPIDVYLDLRDLGWHETMVFAALWIAQSLGLGDAPMVQQLESALKPPQTETVNVMHEAFDSLLGNNSIFETRTSGGPPKPTALQWFRNNYRQICETISLGRAQYWDLATGVIAIAEAHCKKPVILILDGLEKLSESRGQILFYEEARWLEDMPCRAIITAPLFLSFLPSFGDIEERFSAVERLRAISCKSGEPGFDFFRNIARGRGANEVMDQEYIDMAIPWSGGTPRQFLQILSSAATQAISDGLSQVPKEAFGRARQRTAERWQYQLEPGDYASLSQGLSQLDSAARARLLRLGAIIEYDKPDGSLQFGINPLVGQMLRRTGSRGTQLRAVSGDTLPPTGPIAG